jgi:membrane protease subunit HflK
MRKGKGQAQKALESAFATSFRILKWVMYAVVIALLLTGTFWVDENEKAVVLRFGRIKAVYGPGFHFGLPYPIDEVKRVAVEMVQSIEVDKVFWHQEVAESDSALPLHPSLEYGYTLTSDANIIHSKWVVFYRINNPVEYLFGIKDADNTLANALENAVVEASAQFTVDEATRSGKEEFQRTVEWVFKRNLEEIGYGNTFYIQNVRQLEDPKPPLQTEKAFAAVIDAEQDRDNELSAARGEASTILNNTGGASARALVNAIDDYRAAVQDGDADRITESEKRVSTLLAEAGGAASDIVSQAESDKKGIVTEAEADAKRIADLKKWYDENPKILIYEKLFELYAELFKERVVYLLTETTAKGGRELRVLINPDPDVERAERQKRFLEELK